MPTKEKVLLIFGVPDQSFYKRLRAKKAFVAELRPSLEGSRIVAPLLLKKKVQPVVICDNMMAFCMQQGLVKDVAIFYQALDKKTALCRTGSLIAALCAKKYKIPVYLYKAGALSKIKRPLFQIAGMRVTTANIKTYVPLWEEVPLRHGQIKTGNN